MAILKSFMRNLINSTYAIASASAIKTREAIKHLKRKKHSTKSMQHTPSTPKNIIDGKICLYSISLPIARIDDAYASPTNTVNHPFVTKNTGLFSPKYHFKSKLKQYEQMPATMSVQKSPTTMPNIRFKYFTS